MKARDQADIATAFMLALLRRSEGEVVLTMDELKEVFDKSFVYRVEDDRIRLQLK